jgi:hypothetical protein
MRHVTLTLSIFAIALVPIAFGEQTLREIDLSNLRKQGKVTIGEAIEPNAGCSFAQLRIQNLQGEKKTFAVLTISEPCITATSYALTGKVRYENIEGTGYLEMWNHFPDGKMYFSRTLGDSGPMQSLSGSSDWRPFTLPFYINTPNLHPTQLEFNVVLPGRGTVYLGPIKLVQFDKGQLAGTIGGSGVNAWWTDRAAGWVGGIGGGVGGIVIGTVGAIIGILTWSGTGRRVCLWLLGIMFVFGLIVMTVGLGGGLAALAFSQPYAVWYPLLIIGASLGLLCTILPAALFSTIKRVYEQRELRKMRAMDTR